MLMQFRHLEGPFCRSCGLAATRRLSAETLIQGWWGVASFFITPVILVLNAVLLRRLSALPEPVPVSGPPADPGQPLTRRWQMVGLLAPLVILALALLR
ncbi:MAG TPA: hypothetical protein VFP72_20280 [Kineosporiaceae bacterium]|nr:hypothetical protein [Kineosporiaceae bacterium]